MEENKEMQELEQELVDTGYSEDELIKNIIKAANYTEDTDLWKEITVKRGKKELFSFRIRPLTIDEIEYCKERGRKYKAERGRRVLVDTDENITRAELIYKATVEEDKLKIWDNKRVQKALDVMRGTDVVTETLRVGEIDAIIDELNEISGYFDEVSKEEEEVEEIKN